MKWITDNNSPTGERLVSDKQFKKSKSKFDLSKLKKDIDAISKVADALTHKHNPSLNKESEIYRKIKVGFTRDITFLIEEGLISIP